MSLIKWSPFLSDNYFDDMDKMISEFMSISRGNKGFMPAVDMYEDNDNVVVETQLAGIDPEQIEVAIENDVLCIKGEGEKKTEVEEKNYYRNEIRRGNFYRSIPLPTRVDGDKASAVAEEGIFKNIYP